MTRVWVRMLEAFLPLRVRKDCDAAGQRGAGNTEDADAGGAPPAGGDSAPSGESGESSAGPPGKDGSRRWSPREGTRRPGECSGPRVTAEAPHVSLASSVGCVVILTSERRFTQDKPVLGQKMPPSTLTHVSSTQKKTLFCVLDSASVPYPPVCPSAQWSAPSAPSLTPSETTGSCASVLGCVVAPDP